MTLANVLRVLPLLLVTGLMGCLGGGGGGGGGSGSGSSTALADRFVASGNSDGTISILRVDPVAGFANATAFLNVSAFPFRKMIHDAANGRLVAVTSSELHLLPFDAATGGVALGDARDTSGDSSHLFLSDDGSVAYVASGTTAGAIQVYKISEAGFLSPPVSTSLAVSPSFVTLNPAGDRLYVVSRTDDQIVVFDIDADGVLVADPVTIDTDQNPTGLVFNKPGTVAYLSRSGGSSDSLQIHDVEEGGALTFRNAVNVGTSLFGLLLDANGAHLYAVASNDRIYHYQVESATGDLTFIDSHNVASGPNALTFSPTGAELYISHSQGAVVSTLAVDPSDGTLTVMDSARIFNNANTVAAIGGNGALVPTATFLLTPDVSGLRIFEVGADGGLTLQDTESGSHALISGEVAVDYTAGLLLGAGRTADAGNPRQDLLTSYQFDPENGDLALIESVDATVLQINAVPGFQRIKLGRSGRFLYVLDQDGVPIPSILRTFAYAADGEITTEAISNINVGSGPENLSMHPAGRNIYSINSDSDTITGFQFASTNGAPQAPVNSVPGQQGPGVGRPIDLKFHPNGRYAYASLANDHQMVNFFVSPTAGLGFITRQNAPQVDGSDVRPGPIGVHPSGQYLYVGEDVIDGDPNKVAIYDINQTNFTLAFRSRIDVADDGIPSWIEIDPLGRFLYVRFRDQRVQVFTIDESGDLIDTQQVVDAGSSAGRLPSMTLVAPLR